MRPKKSSPSIENKPMVDFLQRKLFQWTCERHATNQPLNREILGDKAIDLSIELGLKGFKCSRVWIKSFLKMHGFSPSLSTHYGPVLNDYREWIEFMRPYTSQYRYKNVFHVDEVGMYHDVSPEMIPPRSDVYATCENGEAGESRVTILLCCNASGAEKLPPVICGKFENRLAPDNHCQYHTNQNAWLTPGVFKVWLSQLNALMSQLNRKILLMLNRTRVHTLKDTVLSNVSLLFFPKEFPPDLQPLRADIFHRVKMIYRRSYTQRMVQPNFNWTPTDTISTIVTAWNSVPKEFVLSSFRRTHFRSDNDMLQISCPGWEDLDPGISFLSYVTFDDNLCVSGSSPTRNSKRLAEIRIPGNTVRCCAPGGNRSGGYHEPIELGDSYSEEDVVEEVSSIPSTSKFNHDYPVVPSHDEIVGPLIVRKGENGDFENAEVVDSDLINSRCSEDRGDLPHRVRPLTDTVMLYISDIVKNTVGKAVDNIPDLMEVTSGLNRRGGTGDVMNRRGIEEDDDSTPITRKRRREVTDEDDLSNDDSWEPTEKKTEKQAWSDIYEHSFVFGAAPVSPQGTTSAGEDVETALVRPTINSIQKNDDLEKKSIFTVSNASPGRTQN